MFSKIFLTIVCCFIAIISCNVDVNIFEPSTAEYKEAFFARQLRQNIKVRNSAFQSPCFVYYFPILDGLNQNWAEQDANCKSNASTKYDIILSNLEQYKAKLNSSADEVTDSISSCKTMENPVESLTCMSGLSASQTEPIYDISKNADNVLFGFNVEANGIRDDMYVCTNATQRQYAKESNKVYQEMNVCLIYGVPPKPDTPAIPTAPPTTAASI